MECCKEDAIEMTYQYSSTPSLRHSILQEVSEQA
ncbi:MAG: hypothetical protein H6R37_226 [Deltaproteobacteria bacterium]|nr:hypothetical protein [Deltaproteobacteria bacterium]